MKIYSIALISLFVLAACQKAPNRAADDAAKPQEKAAPVAENTRTVQTDCKAKESAKDMDVEGKVINTFTTESTTKAVNTSELTGKVDGVNQYKVSGELLYTYTETDDKGEKTTGKNDYTYTGTKTSVTEEIDSKNYKQVQTRKVIQTGRNGFQFYNGKDKPKTDSRNLESKTEMTVFDDGVNTSYLTSFSYTANGKTIEDKNVSSYITTYKTEGAVTTNVTTLKQPVLIKYEDGSSREVSSFEETCVDTVVQQPAR